MTVHTEELVYTDSDDGVLLTGMLMRLTSVSEKPIAVVYIHGRPVSSFIPIVSNLGHEVVKHRYPFLTANTRGHDVGTWLFRRDGKEMFGVRGGSCSTSARSTPP